MNPRILKKLSKRALPLLGPAGIDHGRDRSTLSEDGDDCDVRCQRVRSLDWVLRKSWNERESTYPDCLDGTPIVYRHGTDYCGEGDEGATAWAQLVYGVDIELCQWVRIPDDELDPDGIETERPVYRRIKNPSAYLRHARELAEKRKTRLQLRTTSQIRAPAPPVVP